MSRILPPLANVIAVYSQNPARLAQFAARVQADRALRVHRPGPYWIAAFHPLPLSVADSEQVLKEGYVFAEGREDVSSRADPIPGLRRLGQSLDHREPRQLATISGDFTFFRFKSNGAVTAVRSCGGLVPVYIQEDRDDLVLSTHATWLAKYANWRGEPDWLITAMWLSGWATFAKNRSHLQGVSILHKGERYDRQPAAQGCITRYWYPPKSSDLRWPNLEAEEQHQSQFRANLIESLRTNLDPAGGNLLSLSGGVDSSSLLALAAGQLHYGVKTFSIVPPKTARFYGRAMGYLESLWGEYGVEHEEMESRTERELDLLSEMPPLMFPIFNPTTLALIGPMRNAGIRVSFGGEFADEVVGSSAFTRPDWARHVPVWRLPALLKRMPPLRPLPRHIIQQKLMQAFTGSVAVPFPATLQSWMSPNLEAERAALQASVEKEWADWGIGAAANPNLWLRMIYMDFQPMQWEICSWLDVRRFSPFSIRTILELALRCHPIELIGPGTKRLLRGSLKGLVPAKYLERTDKGAFGPQRSGPPRRETACRALPDRYWEPLLSAKGNVEEGASAYLMTLAGYYACRYRAALDMSA
jgi:hypothetical protein